jgi:tetratricopeptide (TPR) repeat protein
MKENNTRLLLLLLMGALSCYLLNAQPPSDDGMTYVTNSDGRVSLVGSQEELVWSDVHTALRKGYITNALAICNGVLATDPKQRWAKLARMQVWGELGEAAKAEQDFEDLTRDYPNFLEAYNWRAIMLLEQPMPTNGTPPLADWLNSTDEHKRTAAKDLIERTLKILSDHENSLLNSPNKETQRKALESLQLAWKLDQWVEEEQFHKLVEQPQDKKH